jgi:hypothetical protein
MFPSFNFPDVPKTQNDFQWNSIESQPRKRKELNRESKISPRQEEENSLFKIIENWGRQLKVSVEKEQLTVQHLKNFIIEEKKFSQYEIDRMRIIFNGKELENLEERLSPLFIGVKNPTIHVIINAEKRKKRKIED